MYLIKAVVGGSRTTFLAENGFGWITFLADYDLFIFCQVIFSADLDFLIRRSKHEIKQHADELFTNKDFENCFS